MLICHNYDKSNGNIEGIFNSIQLDSREALSFDLLTIINICNKEWKKLTIFYCIYNVKKGVDSAKIINKSVYRLKQGMTGVDGRTRGTSLKNLVNAVVSLEVSNMKFTEKGDYEIRIYVFWDEEKDEITKLEAKDLEAKTLVSQSDNFESVINIEIF